MVPLALQPVVKLPRAAAAVCLFPAAPFWAKPGSGNSLSDILDFCLLLQAFFASIKPECVERIFLVFRTLQIAMTINRLKRVKQGGFFHSVGNC